MKTRCEVFLEMGEIVDRGAHLQILEHGHAREDARPAPLVVAEAVWQYTHHMLPGLVSTEGQSLLWQTGAANGRGW